MAASLVGAVVVVIGFASGLGSRPGTESGAAPAPDDHPPATAPVTTTQTQAPQAHSTGGGSSGGGGAVPVATEPQPPPGNDYTGHPMPPPPTTTTPPTTTPPTTPCQPGFVPTAVDTLLGTLGRATDALGLGAAPGLIGTTVAVLPALPEGTPLDQLIATCQPATPTPTPTTTSTAPTGHGG